MSDRDISARRIGAEREPIAIVEGFHPDPGSLVDAARIAAFVPAGRHYPGIRAALPASYLSAVRPALATVLGEVFAAGESARLLDASFSMVTTDPAELSITQRLPHVDAVEPGRIALVHYLSEGDGTAFYRHRATGFETITAARAERYYATLNDELRDHRPDPGYLHDSTALFERTAIIAARPNRAVIYRSALLHSGAITPAARLEGDPAAGRLTITAFLAAA